MEYRHIVKLFVSQAYADPMHRLELRWRPNHIYSKPACGDRHTVTNLLLRVRRRKKTHQSSCSDPSADSNTEVTESQDYEYEGRILGVIDTVYKFQCKHFIGTAVHSYARNELLYNMRGAKQCCMDIKF